MTPDPTPSPAHSSAFVAALAPLAACGPCLYVQLGRAEAGPTVIGVHVAGGPPPRCLDRSLEGTPITALGWRPGAMQPFDQPDARRVTGLDHRSHLVWGGLISVDEQIFGWIGLVGEPSPGAAPAWAAARAAVLALEAEARRLPAEPATLLLGPTGALTLGSGPTAAWAAVPSVATALPRLAEAPALSSGLRAARVACAARPMHGAAGAHLLIDLRPIPPLAAPAATRLSTVQCAVAEYAAAGATVLEIAAAIHRSPETVRTHLKRVYKALGVASRVELVAALGQDWP